jgi:hypothetical protein
MPVPVAPNRDWMLEKVISISGMRNLNPATRREKNILLQDNLYAATQVYLDGLLNGNQVALTVWIVARGNTYYMYFVYRKRMDQESLSDDLFERYLGFSRFLIDRAWYFLRVPEKTVSRSFASNVHLRK